MSTIDLTARARPRSRGHHRSHTAPVSQWGPAEAPSEPWVDARGHKRSAATMPGAGKGRAPASKGRKYPPNPPTMLEIVQLINACPDTPAGHRLRALIVLLAQTGLRIGEALALVDDDLDPVKGSIVVQAGKGGKRRIVGMDVWGWDQFRPWLVEREFYPDATGPVFCVLEGETAGRAWNASQVRYELKRLANDAGVTKRITPHQFRHFYASARAREKMDWHLLQRQLGHADLRTLSRYLSGISSDEVVDAARVRPAPTLSAPDLISVLGGERS